MSLARALALLLLALAVSFVLATTGHGDLFISAYNSSLVVTDHPNIYHAVADEPTAVFPNGLSGAPYGPLFYYPTALWLFVLDRLHLVDLGSWRGPDDPAHSLTAIVLLKLPNLAAYLASALVLAKTLRRDRGETAAALWLANPAVLLFSLMMGQNDGWTALASLAALLFALRAIEERPLVVAGRRLPLGTLAMLSLAAGAAVKLTPVMLVPAFAWLVGRSARERLLLAGAGAGAFALSVAPFWRTDYFREHGLFAQQAGKMLDVPTEWAVVLYCGYLALVVLAAWRDDDRSRALLFAFIAFHALFFLLGGWAPQRSVLFLAALALAVPLRRAFALPYVVVTAMALLLALEHGNEIAAGLFAPLSARVYLIPPLVEDGSAEPLHSVLFWLSTGLWLIALPALWLERPRARPRWPAAAPVLLAGGLAVYLAASFAPLPRGLELTPYQKALPSQEVAPGQTFQFFLYPSHDDLRAIAIRIESGDARAAVSVSDGTGQVIYSRGDEPIAPRTNRIELGRIERAAGQLFVVTVRPAATLRVRMVDVPPSLAVAGASLDGAPVGGTAYYTLTFRTTWGALLGDAGARLRGEWRTLVMSAALCVAGFAALGALATARRPEEPA